MSARGFLMLRGAALTAALLALSAAPPLVGAGGGGYRGGGGGYRGGEGYRGDGGYRGGYYGGYRGYRGYGYYPGFGIGIGVGLYDPYFYDYPPTYVYGSPPVAVAPPATGVASPGAAPVEAGEEPPLAPADGRARVQVVVPADAEVWFNGSPTGQRGERREFTSPVLAPGHTYQYEIRAQWTDGGRVVDRTRTVQVRANALVGVDITRPEPIAAPTPLPEDK